MINNSIQRFLEIIILNHWFDKKLCLPLWLEISPINLFNFCEHKSFYSKMAASKVLLAFLCCAIAVATATNTTIEADEYVMQRPAILGMFRFVVSLRINNQHICSGSVLNRNWILTAARCLHGQQPAQVEAFIAGQRLTTGLRYVLTRFVIHPQYNSRSTKNDIALARTRLAIPSLGNSWNIRLPTSTQLPSSALEAGYGFARVSCWSFHSKYLVHLIWFTSSQTHAGIRIKSRTFDRLFTRSIASITNQQCRAALRNLAPYLHPTSRCTGSRMQFFTCVSDTGSPLIGLGQIYGVQSWTVDCTTRHPNVYTDVLPHKKFIEDTIRSWKCCMVTDANNYDN